MSESSATAPSVKSQSSDTTRPTAVVSHVTDAKKSKIYDMHNIIQTTIGQIQDKTQQILQDQERDLIRAFRIRLAQVQEDLEKERKKNESGSAEWVVRCHKLTEELEWLRELADKLTTENNLFLQENKKHARQLASQEQDRAFLLKQLVNAKKENARLRLLLENGTPSTDAQQLDVITGTTKLLPQLPSIPALEATASSPRTTRAVSRQSTAGPSDAGMVSTRLRIEDHSNTQQSASHMVSQLQDQLARAARDHESVVLQLQQARSQSHKYELKCRKLETSLIQSDVQHSELKVFFKQAIDDVRADILARKLAKTKLLQGKGALGKGFLTTTSIPRNATASAAGAGAGAEGSSMSRSLTSRAHIPADSANTAHTGLVSQPLDPRSVPLSAFTVQDRVHVMEWLLTQDHVVRFLYDQLFPASVNSTPAPALGGVGMSVPIHRAQTQRNSSRMHTATNTNANAGAGAGMSATLGNMGLGRHYTSRPAPTGFSRGPATGQRFSMRRPASTPLGAGAGAGRGSHWRGGNGDGGNGGTNAIDPLSILQDMIREAPDLEELAKQGDAEAKAEAEADAQAGDLDKQQHGRVNKYSLTAHIPSRRPKQSIAQNEVNSDVESVQVEDAPETIEDDDERLKAMMEKDFESF